MTFDAKGLLNQLLGAGQGLAQRESGRARSAGGGEGSAAGDIGARLGGFGGGLVSGGVLGLLLGDKRVRKLGGSALTHGGTAVLGALAYRAYADWQSQKEEAPADPPRTLDRISGSEANVHGIAVLKAMIGAARADGHIDERERGLIEAEIARLDDTPELSAWFDDQLRKPLNPGDIAAAATSGEIAAEMYLASRMIVDTQNFMEGAYLHELARCMKLDPDLQKRLDEEAESALAAPAE